MKSARAAGSGVFVALGALLLLNLIWIGRHCDGLRPLGAGEPAPPFVLPRADGSGNGDLAALAGKVVLVDFWATWCGPCQETMPVLERLYQKHHGAGLEILSVNTEGQGLARKALAFATRHGLTFPILMDDGEVARRYRVESLPYLVVVDRQGMIRRVHIGLVTVSGLERALDSDVRRLLAP